jgi:pyruvate/2-oxoglutarate dehydrogenase complex dihydrolipoamide dehydrogenase (E3) component
MAERFDVILLGMGPGGEAAAGRLVKGGKKVAVVERELIGGECAYWEGIRNDHTYVGDEGALRLPGLHDP